MKLENKIITYLKIKNLKGSYWFDSRDFIKFIRARQLKFTGHCLRMAADEPAHRFVLYESKVKSSKIFVAVRQENISTANNIISSKRRE